TLLKRKLSAEVGRKDQIITVALSSPFHEEAVKIVDAIVNAYKNYQDASSKEGASKIVELLGKQKQKAEEELAKVRQEQLELRKSANVLNFDSEKDNYIRQQLSSLSQALTDAHLETMKAREALESSCRVVGLDPDEPDPQNDSVALSNQDEELLRADLFAQKQVLAEQRRSYGPEHPKVKSQAARVEQFERAYAGSARARWRAATAREQELQRSFETQQKLAIEQSALAARYAQLVSDEKRLATQCDELDKQ